MIVTLDQLKTSLQAVKRYINKIKTTIISGIAEEFDVSSSYSAGDYVYYNGKLYKFTADHVTGVFDGTDAVEVTVADEIESKANKDDFDMSIGTVTTLPAGSDATASITGDYDAMELDLGIPRGDTGVYLGTAEPTDTGIKVWIDTSENSNPYVETVTGSDPVIEAEPNCRYVCGEVYTLSITPPDTGTTDIMFTSGSTPTVLTLPNTVKMPEWWNGVEANYTYEICIMDGVYAGVSMWPI